MATPATGAMPDRKNGDSFPDGRLGDAPAERRRERGARSRLSFLARSPGAPAQPHRPARLRARHAGGDRPGGPRLGADSLADPATLPRGRAKTTLAWQKALAEAMRLGPRACGIARPTWTAPLLATYLAQQTGIAVS